jgi:nicotinamide-nucleotide amidase
MQVEIITIGDEILIGQIVDTNSAWMAQELNLIGLQIKQITTVSDDESAIINALEEALNHVDIILITGGLGPTKDDLTKNTLCKYFKTKLIFDARAFEDVERLFHARGITEIREINRRQAEVPEGCKVLYNGLGTAPGMWFEKNNKIVVSMPGVPFEMEAMMKNDVLPKLKNQFKLPFIQHKTMLTHGIGESFLAELISEWEDKLPSNIKLAYLPSAGSVKLRLSGLGKDPILLNAEIEKEVRKVEPFLRPYLYGYDTDSVESIVGGFLKQTNKTLVTAESCTGGYMAHLITRIPGCSTYYLGSVVAYSNESKQSMLQVDPSTLENNGAVSEQTVIEMARGAKKKFNADFAIACSGIAGPDGGTVEKPIGTVWIAIATPDKIVTQHFLFGKNRERTIQRTSQTGLHMLIKELKSLI